MKSALNAAFWAAVLGAMVAEGFAGTISAIRDALMSDPQSVTEGRIVKSKVFPTRRGGQAYDIQYVYTVDGKEYTGSQIDYDVKTADPRRMVKRYPVGSTVEVFFDASKPSYATLEKRPLGWSIYLHIFLWLFIIGFVYVVFLPSPLERPHTKNDRVKRTSSRRD